MRLENRDALNVFILVVFAISQPLFSLLGNNPLFFGVRHSDYQEVVYFTFLLGVFVPGLAALICFLAYKLQRHFGRIVSAALIGLCVILIFSPLFNQWSGISGKTAILLNLCLALVTTVLYFALPVLSTFTTFLAPAARGLS